MGPRSRASCGRSTSGISGSYASGEQQRAFSFIQSNRAKKGGQKRREKRADRDAAIIQAVQAGGESMRAVARAYNLYENAVRHIIKRGAQ